MGELGNVFDAIEPVEPAGPNARAGRDLVANVEVDPRDLGADEGQRVHVPRKLPFAGEAVSRAVHPSDDDEWVRLHLGEGFPDGGALKLRGQGEAGSHGGANGDLILKVRLVEGTRALAPPTHEGFARRSTAVTVTAVAVALGVAFGLYLALAG